LCALRRHPDIPVTRGNYALNGCGKSFSELGAEETSVVPISAYCGHQGKAGEGTIRLGPCFWNQDSNALAVCSTRAFNLQYEDKNRLLTSRSFA
jgi:hypothetical protein